MYNFNATADLENCNFTLQNMELWKQFQKLQTEMVITKIGRRMFPRLKVQISGLDPDEQYCIFMEMKPAARCRFRYSASTGWTPAGGEEAHNVKRIYLHPESPATGQQWMSRVVSFAKLKLTNNPASPDGQLVLNSMHKYEPQIIIAKTIDPKFWMYAPTITKAFTEASFITVTAYQNLKCKELKINHNPFAKGFRADGRSRCKKRLLDTEEQPNEELNATLLEYRSENEASDSHSSSIDVEDRRESDAPISEASASSPPPLLETAHYNQRRSYVSNNNTQPTAQVGSTYDVCTNPFCISGIPMPSENPYHAPYAPMYAPMPASFSPYYSYQLDNYNAPVHRPSLLPYYPLSLRTSQEIEQTRPRNISLNSFSIRSILDMPTTENDNNPLVYRPTPVPYYYPLSLQPSQEIEQRRPHNMRFNDYSIRSIMDMPTRDDAYDVPVLRSIPLPH